MPDTDAISPLTCASPLGGVAEGVLAPEVPGEAAVVPADEVALGGLLVELQAARESAVAPVTARIATRLSRADMADINVSPFVR
ncbi:hypothetical protein A9W99_14270 [Mycobacterium sp. 1164966.3]|nr:hypothetical protein A9W99_14270 [Mycobacterium sp. 1164966.3]